MRILVAVFAVFLVSSAAHGEDLVIENTTVVDGTGGPNRPGMTVVITGGRFSSIGASKRRTPPNTRRIDGTGKYLMPGLIDVHVHLTDEADESPRGQAKIVGRLASFLLAGVTTIYDAGGHPQTMSRMRKNERAGRLAAPRVFSTVRHLSVPGGQGSDDPGALLLGEGTVVDPKLRAYFDQDKPDMVKIIAEEGGFGPLPKLPSFNPAMLRTIARAAHRRGIRTTIHISTEGGATQAIVAGVDTLAHPVIATPVSPFFVKLVAARRIPIATTMAVGDARPRVVENPAFLDEPIYAASLSAAEISAWRLKGRTTWRDSKWTPWRRQTVRLIQTNLFKMHSEGAVLALGSDLGLGAFSQREMELLQEAGIKPIDIIRIATLNGARFLGRERELGSIQVGKKADAVLVSADPTKDVRNAQRVFLVIKGGEVIPLNTLPLEGDRSRVR